jgi:hypothetical protein
MPANRDRLNVRFFRFIEGEADGRFAIVALVVLLLAIVILLRVLK